MLPGLATHVGFGGVAGGCALGGGGGESAVAAAGAAFSFGWLEANAAATSVGAAEGEEVSPDTTVLSGDVDAGRGFTSVAG